MMNAINPNDLLAKRVIDIAKYNRTGDSFIKGMETQLEVDLGVADKHSFDGVWQIHRRVDAIATYSDISSAGCRLKKWYKARIRSFTTPHARRKRGRRREGECRRDGP